MTRPIPPYPDELVGSWLIRVCRHLGVHRNQLSQFLVHGQKLNRIFLFLPQPDILFHFSGLTKEQLLLQHTPLRYITSCMDRTSREVIVEKLLQETVSYDASKGRAVLTQSVTNGVITRRYCPVCIEQDLYLHGETFWRREHHLPLAYWCLDHHEPLHRTFIPLTNDRECQKLSSYDDYDSLPGENEGSAYLPDLPKQFIREFAVKNRNLLNQSSNFEFSSQLHLQYRNQAYLNGFGVAGNDIQAMIFNNTFIDTYPQSLLADAGVPLTTRAWPCHLLNEGLTNLVPAKHVLVSTFLDFQIPPVQIANYCVKRKPRLPIEDLDNEFCKVVATNWKRAIKQKKQICIKDVIGGGLNWSRYKHARQNYPKTVELIKQFLKSTAALYKSKTKTATDQLPT